VLSATKVFNENDSIAKVTFFSSKKRIISKGKMNGKRYIGEWIYFHKDSDKKMIIEYYNDEGQLEGERTVFYKSGGVAETSQYKNGELDGVSKWYSEDKILLRESHYKGGMLNGKNANYDQKGRIMSEGNYEDDKKSGIWKYYEQGKIKKEIDHTNQKIIKKYD